MLAKGIASAAMYPIHAIEDVVKRMRAYLPFSPARVGPFRDLHRVKIVEQIATAIRPDAAVRAMRRTAMALAVSGAMIMPGAAGASGGIVINMPVTINGDVSDGGAAIKKQLDGHVSYLVDRIKHELSNRARSDF
jgi:hypothetical protein